MKNILFLAAGLIVFFSACKPDPELDPLQFDLIKKASILTLRGTAVDNLGVTAYLGAVDSFSISGDAATEFLEFDADFQSEDQSLISKVEVFAKTSEAGARSKVATKEGSTFAIPSSGGNYKQGSFKIPLNDILTATGTSLSSIAEDSYIFIECDLYLTDGSVVPASAVVNSSLFESSLFYPAHNLRYIAGK